MNQRSTTRRRDGSDRQPVAVTGREQRARGRRRTVGKRCVDRPSGQHEGGRVQWQLEPRADRLGVGLFERPAIEETQRRRRCAQEFELSLFLRGEEIVRDLRRLNGTHRFHVETNLAGRRDGARHQPARVRQAEHQLSVGEARPSAVVRRELPGRGGVAAARGKRLPQQRVCQGVVASIVGPAQALEPLAFPAGQQRDRGVEATGVDAAGVLPSDDDYMCGGLIVHGSILAVLQHPRGINARRPVRRHPAGDCPDERRRSVLVRPRLQGRSCLCGRDQHAAGGGIRRHSAACSPRREHQSNRGTAKRVGGFR